MKKNEAGRSMAEIILVLAISAVLAVVGVTGYTLSIQQKKINDILNTLQMNVIAIHSAIQGKEFSSLEEKEAFLGNYKARVGEYQLSFHATEDDKGGFVTQITTDNGDPIKGGMCKKLIAKMAKQRFVYDIDFTVTGEENEEGYLEKITVPLNGQVVDMDAICGD